MDLQIDAIETEAHVNSGGMPEFQLFAKEFPATPAIFGDEQVAALPCSLVANSVTNPPIITPPSTGIRLAGLGGFVFALLQSLCTAVLAISGVRVAIGLTALAAASGIYAPAKGFHQDAIRIPMLIVGGVGAAINLAVLVRVWTLRARSSGNWRRRVVSKKERRSERLQLALAIVTLILVALEVWTHTLVHRTGPPPQVHSQAEPFATSRSVQA